MICGFRYRQKRVGWSPSDRLLTRVKFPFLVNRSFESAIRNHSLSKRALFCLSSILFSPVTAVLRFGLNMGFAPVISLEVELQYKYRLLLPVPPIVGFGHYQTIAPWLFICLSRITSFLTSCIAIVFRCC